MSKKFISISIAIVMVFNLIFLASLPLLLGGLNWGNAVILTFGFAIGGILLWAFHKLGWKGII